jgi:ribosome-associated toxin RatA of RatAB toxin-antitoxin module
MDRHVKPFAPEPFLLFVCLLLFLAQPARAADWVPTSDELARLKRGEVVVTSSVERVEDGGNAVAAVQIDAPVERVFRTLIDCKQAVQFVPHLEQCKVLETADDESWRIVEHEMGTSWYLPSGRFMFRAEYEPYKLIRFTQMRGDFRENKGVWTFKPINNGRATIVSYNVHIVPRTYVPRWIVRASLRRGLPALMDGLRAQCEEPASVNEAALQTQKVD